MSIIVPYVRLTCLSMNINRLYHIIQNGKCQLVQFFNTPFRFLPIVTLKHSSWVDTQAMTVAYEPIHPVLTHQIEQSAHGGFEVSAGLSAKLWTALSRNRG